MKTAQTTLYLFYLKQYYMVLSVLLLPDIYIPNEILLFEVARLGEVKGGENDNCWHQCQFFTCSLDLRCAASSLQLPVYQAQGWRAAHDLLSPTV